MLEHRFLNKVVQVFRHHYSATYKQLTLLHLLTSQEFNAIVQHTFQHCVCMFLLAQMHTHFKLCKNFTPVFLR